MARSMTPFRVSFPLLIHRSTINFKRNLNAVVVRISQVTGFAVVLALFYAPFKSDYYSIQSRLGFVQQFSSLYFVGMLQNIAVYPTERDVFYRESDDGAYSVEAFFLQYAILEVAFEIMTSILFAILTIVPGGLPRTPKLFFIVAFNCFGIVSCGESLGIMFTTIFPYTGFAVNVCGVVLSVTVLMGGVLSLNVPTFLQAFNHLNPIRWAIGNLGPYTFVGQKFTCTKYQQLLNGSCPFKTGEEVFEQYNLNKNARLNIMALGICIIIYRLVAYGILKIQKRR